MVRVEGGWREGRGEKGQGESEREVGRKEPIIGDRIERWHMRANKTKEEAMGGMQVRMKGWRRDGRVSSRFKFGSQSLQRKIGPLLRVTNHVVATCAL